MNRHIITAGASLLSAAAGAAATYFVMKRKLDEVVDQMDATIEHEIESAREFFEKLHKTGPYSSPQSTAEKLIESQPVDKAVQAMVDYRGGIERVVRPTDTEILKEVVQGLREDLEVDPQENVVATNVFHNQANGDFDPNKPYVVDLRTFQSGATAYDKSELTYFEEDGALVDERQSPFDKNQIELMVGCFNLTQFGVVKTDDPNVLHVRNDEMEMDFEIVRSPGAFSREVLGQSG